MKEVTKTLAYPHDVEATTMGRLIFWTHHWYWWGYDRLKVVVDMGPLGRNNYGGRPDGHPVGIITAQYTNSVVLVV